MRARRSTKGRARQMSKSSAVGNKQKRGRPSASSRDAGSIGDAATKAAKSGARLVGHTGQMIVMAATNRTRVALAKAAIGLASSLPNDAHLPKASRRGSLPRRRRARV